MSTAARPPRWTSHRRLLEMTLADLHRCSDLRLVKQAHAQVFKLDLHGDLFVAPKLVAAYSLCRHMSAAAAVFEFVLHTNTHLCNTIMRAYADNAQPRQAFSVFFAMRRSGVLPDNFTYPCLLKAFTSSTSETTISQVEMIHAHIVKMGFLGDIFVPNSLLDSYHRCGGGAAAAKLFDEMPHRDIVSWNTMIAGLVRVGNLAAARQLFDEMPDRDVVTWNAILAGYARSGEADEAFELFKTMPERNIVSWSTVISGYCKKGDMDMARLLFDKMPARNLVSWTIIISAYAERGEAREATALFRQMEESGLTADGAAIVSILSACAESGLLGLGKKVDAHITRTNARRTTPVCNALLDMYAKCGDLRRARAVFRGTPARDLVSRRVDLSRRALRLRARRTGRRGPPPLRRHGERLFGEAKHRTLWLHGRPSRQERAARRSLLLREGDAGGAECSDMGDLARRLQNPWRRRTGGNGGRRAGKAAEFRRRELRRCLRRLRRRRTVERRGGGEEEDEGCRRRRGQVPGVELRRDRRRGARVHRRRSVARPVGRDRGDAPPAGEPHQALFAG